MSDSTAATDKSREDVYLSVWKIEQEHSRMRWTVATFFFSVSFAIFGFSFTTVTPLGSPINHIQRLAGLVLFWFSYALFFQFNRYTHFLRGKLKDMEQQGEVRFTFQSDAAKVMYGKARRATSATWLLFYLGLVYTAAVLALIGFGVTLIK
jgi:hypothetical protein